VCLEKEALRGGSRPSIGNGAASRPVFSPDGSEIAFTATYDGNADVYVTPANGGTPRRSAGLPGRGRSSIAIGRTYSRN
jgi:Tol biopolymer transport system component